MRLRMVKVAALGWTALSLWHAVAWAGDTGEIVLPPVPDAPPASIVVLQSTGAGPDSIVTALQGRRAVTPAQSMPDFGMAAPAPSFADVTGSISRHPEPAPSAPPMPDAKIAPVEPAAADTPIAATPVPIAEAPQLLPADIGAAMQAFLSADPSRWRQEPGASPKQRLGTRQAIAAYYAVHENAPLWIEGGALSARARAVLGRVDRAGEDGLDLAAYALPTSKTATAAQLAEADLAISEAVVAYARQASGSRIDPARIDPLIIAKPVVPEPADILAWLSVASDPEDALHAYDPPQPGYAALRAKLAELRRQDIPVAQDAIPSGPILRPGMRDNRVPLIRARFGLDLPSASQPDGLVYDTKVAAAIADFQRTNGLPASGILTARTVAALSGGNPTRLENELVANMERWRWLPRDLGDEYILVNVPDYSLEVVDGDAVIHKARVVVGKPDHQTPLFSNTMRFVIVNPYWNVPLSIIKKEMLPKLADDPNYFADHGYEVVERNGVTMVRQPPGEDNALGRIKFMFPNAQSVYLHDTNARALFGKDKRAFSHGCVRVDQPFKLAEVVLGPKWPEARVQKLIGGDERTINLPKPLPIHIAYFTSFVDEAGALRLRDDVYGYSGRVKIALGLQD